jgi:hypothetical protein
MDFTRDTVTVKKDRTTVIRRKTTKKGKDGLEYPVIQQIVYQEDGTTLVSHVGDTQDFDSDPGGFNEQPPLIYNRNAGTDESEAANKLYAKDFQKADTLIVDNLQNKEVVKAERVGTGVYDPKEIGDPKGDFYYKGVSEQKEDATPVISKYSDPTVIKGVAAERAKSKVTPKAPDYKTSKEKAANETASRKEAQAIEEDKKNGAYAKQTAQVPMRKVKNNVTGQIEEYPADWSLNDINKYNLTGDAPAGKSSPDGTPSTGGDSSQDTDSEAKGSLATELTPEQKAMEEAANKKAATIENDYDQKSKAAEDNFNKATAAADAAVEANDTANAAKNPDTASQKALNSRNTSDPSDSTQPADMSPAEAEVSAKALQNYEDAYGSAGLDKVDQDAAISKSVERSASLEEAQLPNGSSVKQGMTSRQAMKTANEALKNKVVQKVEVYPTVAGGTPQTPPQPPDKRAADFYRNGKETLTEPGYDIAPREFIPIDIKDSPSSLRVFGKGHGNGKSIGTMRDLIPAYSKFIIEGVSESRTERSQIVETFGDFYVFMFGERPSVMNFNCQLINGANINWLHDFMFMYDSYLRGTRCVEQNASCIVTYGGKQVSGLILNCSAQINAAVEGAVAMSFSLVVFERNYFYYSPDLGVYTNSKGTLETYEPLVKTLATIANPEGKGMAARNASIANKFAKKTMEGAPAKGPIHFPS